MLLYLACSLHIYLFSILKQPKNIAWSKINIYCFVKYNLFMESIKSDMTFVPVIESDGSNLSHYATITARCAAPARPWHHHPGAGARQRRVYAELRLDPCILVWSCSVVVEPWPS